VTYHKEKNGGKKFVSLLTNFKQTAFPKLNQGHKVEINKVQPEVGAIPNLIHQTFYTKALPAELQGNIEKIRLLNPDWTHKLYDDSDKMQFI